VSSSSCSSFAVDIAGKVSRLGRRLAWTNNWFANKAKAAPTIPYTIGGVLSANTNNV